MLPGSEPMGAPASFTARRPNASNLPQFELPPPQLPKYQPPYSLGSGTAPLNSSVPTSLASVGNLLTPPSGSSSDGLSPASSGVNTGSTTSNQAVPPYTPNGYSWSQPANPSNNYGYQSSMSPSAFIPPRGLYSPSINSIVKGSNSPTAQEGMSNGYGDMPPYSTSMSMSAPVSLPALPSQQVMSGVSQASPMSAQEAFARPPPTPTTYYAGSQASSTPAQTPYGFSSGPSPVQHSPISAGGMTRFSPTHHHGSIPSIHSQQSPYGAQRPFSYPLPGPVLSNMNNPGGSMALVGHMHGGMVGYNSGHAAQMQHMYAHPHGHANPTSDRPFKCDQCPQSFNRNHDLKRHKRIHLAVKPFPCGHCDKSFSRKDALKRHILVKGCGKTSGVADGDKSEGSISPGSNGAPESSPVIAAPA